MHARIDQRRQLANFGWDWAVELVVAQAPAQRGVGTVNGERGTKCTEAGRSEVSARRGRREERAGGSAAMHAQMCQRRHQANFEKKSWDWAVELVASQVPAQRGVGRAPMESVR